MKGCYIRPRENGTLKVQVVIRIDHKRLETTGTYKPDPCLSLKQNYENAEKLGAVLMEELRKEHEEEKEKKNPTFRDFYNEVYLPVAKSKLASTTLEFNMDANEKFFMDTFGDVKLKKITKAMVQDKVQELVNKQNEHSEDPKCIQSQTAIRYLSPFRAVISLAASYGVLERNPLEGGLSFPKVFAPEIKCIDKDDYQAILKYLNAKLNNDNVDFEETDIIVAIALFSGLRRGEIVALRWEDIENLREDRLTRCRICVNASAYKVTGQKQQRGTPKTPASKRSFTIPTILAKILFKWKNSNANRGISVSPEDYIVPNRTGDMISLDTASRWTSRFFEEHKMPKIKLHSLRHTFAAVLVRIKMPIETIREVMGHDDIRTTQIYMYSFEIKEDTLMKDVNAFNEDLLDNEEDNTCK